MNIRTNPILSGLILLIVVCTSAGFANGQTIDKSSVQVRLQVHKGFKGDPETWSWTPVINFRVNAPFPAGSALSVEYTFPGKAWKFDCASNYYGVGWVGIGDCGLNPPDDQSVTYIGPVDFKINLRNELEGKNAALFSGKFKVEKFHEASLMCPSSKTTTSFTSTMIGHYRWPMFMTSGFTTGNIATRRSCLN